MPLSEQELLLLDCFMYSDLAPRCKKGDTLEDIISEFVDPKTKEISLDLIKKKDLQFSGDMSASAFKDILEDIQKSETLKKLKLMETSPEYTGSIRAACFVDESGKATVAFRGTGGSYQQWYNNFEGYGEMSQNSQEDAAAFINSLPYDNIDVTGHSNGGDQAMYVTIVCSDKVNRCVSFEGQGVSKEFAQEYADQITQNKYKIKNICGEKDFVSPLLVDISGETVYVKSDANLLDGLLDHGSYGLYTANKEILSKNNGYFPESAYVEQAWYCRVIHEVTVFLSDHSDTLIVGPVLELFADVAGIVVGLIISKGWKDPEMILKACKDLVVALRDFVVDGIQDCIEAIETICKKIVKCIKDYFNAGAKYSNQHPNIVLDTFKLENYAQRLNAVQKRITKLDKRLDSLYSKVGLLDLWNLMQADLLTGYSWRLGRCANYLRDTASDFENTEKSLMI